MFVRVIRDGLLALLAGFITSAVAASVNPHDLKLVLWAGVIGTAAALVVVLWAEREREWLHGALAKTPVLLRSPVMRRNSPAHRAHLEARKGIDYRFGLKMGRLLEQADPTTESSERERRGEALLALVQRIRLVLEISDERAAMASYNRLHRVDVIRAVDELKEKGDFRPTSQDLLNRFYNQPEDKAQIQAVADRLQILGEDLTQP